jgi:hypothetical protein
MRHRHAHATVLVLAVGLAFLPGCGGGSAKPAVSGTVSFDNTPIDSGSIIFTPATDAGHQKQQASAEIKDGKYTIPAAQAPPEGKYRVQIFWKKKTGKQVDAPGDPGNKIDETKEAIPNKFNKDSTLFVEIKTGENTHDFPLKSR